MKEVLGLRFGGLQHKILNLVLFFLLVVIGLAAGSSYLRSRALSKTVAEARTEQQAAISDTSMQTMRQVLENALVKSTEGKADQINTSFTQIEESIRMLRAQAQHYFEIADTLPPAAIGLPDVTKEGVLAAHVLREAGVDETQSAYLPIAAHLSDTLVAMRESSSQIGGCYIGLADGTHIGVSDHPAEYYDENGDLIPFPVRERPWYVGAVAAGGIHYTDLEADHFNGSISITCSAPVYVADELVGVVGIDIEDVSMMDTMNDSVEEGFAFIVNKDGHVVLAPEENGLFEATGGETAEDLRQSGNRDLGSFVAAALSGKTGLTSVIVNDTEYYMAGAPIDTVGWALIAVVPKTVIRMPAEQMIAAYDGINQEASAAFEDSMRKNTQITVLLVVALLIVGAVTALWLSGRIVRPVEAMTQDIGEATRHGKLFEMKSLYKTGDEIEVLASAFDELSKETGHYIAELTAVTKENERISTELGLARKIQADMLPSIFPPFPDRKEFDIYAMMDPAKEVGGDFYDFFLIDEDHLGLVMADVSGKGIPAALFMMMSKILISNYGMMGSSPAKVLEQANAAICQNNEEEMFVTAWFGVLEISTGKLTAASAGHEYPIICHAGGRVEVFKDRHGFVLGGMEGMHYKEYELRLEKGDALFLYTDGLPEATDAQLGMFGLDRVVETLEACRDCDAQTMLKRVRAAVEQFVGEADQFDDLTMLCLRLLG